MLEIERETKDACVSPKRANFVDIKLWLSSDKMPFFELVWDERSILVIKHTNPTQGKARLLHSQCSIQQEEVGIS